MAKDSPTGQRTEPATDRRRQKSREKGQVCKSVDLNTAVLLLIGFLGLYWFRQHLYFGLSDVLRRCFSLQDHIYMDAEQFSAFSAMIIMEFGKIVAPFLAIGFVGALLVNLAQIGFLFTTEPMKPKPEKFNPINGFKRIFSVKSAAELVKSIVKLFLLGYMPYQFIKGNLPTFLNMMDMDSAPALFLLLWIIFKIAMQICVLLLIFSLADYGFQKWQYEESIKMSKYDIKQERKEVEGDPLIKAEFRRRQMQLSLRRMMSEVPKAEVVITNPTELAVALAYDINDPHSVPTVVAKGAGFVAQRIREIAREHGVFIHENKPLAQSLYKDCEIGEMIPVKLYQSVAKVLAYLYESKRGIAGAPA